MRTPAADRAAAIMAAVEPLPLVPAMWITRRAEVGISQPPQEAPHPPQPQLGGHLGHAHPFVIQAAVEVIEAVLVIVEHGGWVWFDSPGSKPLPQQISGRRRGTDCPAIGIVNCD